MASVELRNFEEHEFNCKCNHCGFGYNKMKDKFLLQLMNAREISDVPYILNSAFRCQTYNMSIGSKTTSSHTKGCAVDIAAEDINTYFRVLAGLILAGFTRLGLGPNFIHVDNDDSKPSTVAWNYYE